MKKIKHLTLFTTLTLFLLTISCTTASNIVINRPEDFVEYKSKYTHTLTIPIITFSTFSASLIIEDDEGKTRKNQETLNKLAALFLKFIEYNIRIEGHANHLDWTEPEKKKIEQETILLPLSYDRAKAVKDALIILGIEEKRMTIVGLGGSVPIVPFDDVDNCWKNERVEFILVKEAK